MQRMNNPYQTSPTPRKKISKAKLWTFIGIGAVVLGGIIFYGAWRKGVAVVGVGDVGIVKHWNGSVTEVQTGTTWVGYGVQIDKLPISVQVDSKDGSLGTQDNQELPISYTLKYRLDDSDASLLYRTTGGRNMDFIQGQLVDKDLQGFLTLEGHKHDYSDFKSQTLGDISSEISQQITSDLKQDGIVVEGFKFTSIGIPKGMEQSQQALAQAEANKQIALQNQATAKIDNETKVMNAKAQAQADEESAKGIMAKAQAMNQWTVAEDMINKWNGQFPTTYAGSGSPFTLFNQVTK